MKLAATGNAAEDDRPQSHALYKHHAKKRNNGHLVQNPPVKINQADNRHNQIHKGKIPERIERNGQK